MNWNELIDPESSEWTPEQAEIGALIMRKDAFTQRQGKYVPLQVFEPHLLTKKNISTEVIATNGQAEVYLVRRPSREESPLEPFPGQFHVPGVTHMATETTEASIERLKAREFAGAKLELVGSGPLGEPEVLDPIRGMYVMKIFLAKVQGTPSNPRGRFFKLTEIPWDHLVASHYEHILSRLADPPAKRA